MMKKRCSIVLSIVVISIFLCSGSFAQDLAPAHLLDEYSVGSRVCEWSDPADLQRLKDKWLAQEQAIYNTLPAYQQQLYNQTRTDLVIQAKLSSIKSIKVYVAKSDVTFEDIRNYYKDQVPGLHLEDLEDVATNRGITDRREKLRLAFAKIPPDYFPTSDDRTRLATYIDSGELKGLIGTIDTSSGGTPESSNISIQPIYVDPETYEVRDDKAAWVIISVYSEVFGPPPLQPD